MNAECWNFNFNDQDDAGSIFRAMHILDFTLAGHPDVKEMCYGFRRIGGSMVLQGYINFFFEKSEHTVNALVPSFQWTDMDAWEDTDQFYQFLNQNCVFVKYGRVPWVNGRINLIVEWHYVDETTEEDFVWIW